MADDLIFSSDSGYKINVKYANNRDYIRVAFNDPVNGTWWFDSVTGLLTDGDVDVLDWHEIWVNVDTVGGVYQISLNGIDKTGDVTNVIASADCNHEFCSDITIGGSVDTSFENAVKGAMQEIWVADRNVANWSGFTVNGVPQYLGVNNDGGTGISPYVYLNRKLGQGFLTNQAALGGQFTEQGTLSDDNTYPLYPGSSLPVNSAPDDTFTYVDALLGDEVPVPSGNPGTEQLFSWFADRSRFTAIGSSLLSQGESSPTNFEPLKFQTVASSDQIGCKGGLFKNLDSYDESMDALISPQTLRCVTLDVDSCVLDGSHAHNAAVAVKANGSIGSDPLNAVPAAQPLEPPPPGYPLPPPDDEADPQQFYYYTSLFNSWFSYGRGVQIDNDLYFNMTIEDCLFDGIHSFMSVKNAGSTRDQEQRHIRISNSLIWLRRLPYPLGHSGKTLGTHPGNADAEAWGHGFLFNYDTTNAPLLDIRDCIFYIEDYAATTGAYSTWNDDAANMIGIPDRITYAANNKIIFGHPTDTYNVNWIPASVQSAFTVTNFSQDNTAPQVFFDARNDWLTNHQSVMRSGEATTDGTIDYANSTTQPYVPYPSFA